MSFKYDVCIIGGAGHVGLPLALAFAEKDLRVLVYDINKTALEKISSGHMPFDEIGAKELLPKVLKKGNLHLSAKIQDVGEAESLVVTIGTPVDEFLNPTVRLMTECFQQMRPYMRDEQLVILRSTVYPGVTEWVVRYFSENGLNCDVSFCPERIVQGHALEELSSLPQVVSGFSERGEERAAKLFASIAPEIVRVKPKEAELTKLFSNAFRYIQFAVTNQFYMICKDSGVDYYRVMHAMKHNYPRMRDVPRAGFAAGPCLFKDTMQLSAFYQNQFSFGMDAVQINEGLPLFLIKHLQMSHDLREKTVGLLGMAFKAECDDRRSSLSYKLKKVLSTQAKQVLTTDPYVTDDSSLLPVEEVLQKSDILILCAPHKIYKTLNIKEKVVVDVWNFFPSV